MPQRAGTNNVAAGVVTESGTTMRPEVLSSRSTSTAFSSAATSALDLLPASGGAAITASVKVRRYS